MREKKIVPIEDAVRTTWNSADPSEWDRLRVETKKVDCNDVPLGELRAYLEARPELFQRVMESRSNILSGAELVDAYPELRPEIISGLLRKGEVMNIISGPKSYKSWLVQSLCLRIASGGMFLDRFKCNPGRALVIDNELHRETTAFRFKTSLHAHDLPAEVMKRVHFLNLRGQLKDIYSLENMIARIPKGYYSVIVLDALYRFFPERTDENDNGQMAQMYNAIDKYAEMTDCAITIVHHTSKGAQGHKSIADVGAGGSAITRATDTHLILREHEQEGVMVIDAAVRNAVKISPFCVRWQFPMWTPADDVDPEELKGRTKDTGAERAEKAQEQAAVQARLDDWVQRITEPMDTNQLYALGEEIGLPKWSEHALRKTIRQMSACKRIRVVRPAMGRISAQYLRSDLQTPMATADVAETAQNEPSTDTYEEFDAEPVPF
jgi:hypothetical protein